MFKTDGAGFDAKEFSIIVKSNIGIAAVKLYSLFYEKAGGKIENLVKDEQEILLMLLKIIQAEG